MVYSIWVTCFGTSDEDDETSTDETSTDVCASGHCTPVVYSNRKLECVSYPIRRDKSNRLCAMRLWHLATDTLLRFTDGYEAIRVVDFGGSSAPLWRVLLDPEQKERLQRTQLRGVVARTPALVTLTTQEAPNTFTAKWIAHKMSFGGGSGSGSETDLGPGFGAESTAWRLRTRVDVANVLSGIDAHVRPLNMLWNFFELWSDCKTVTDVSERMCAVHARLYDRDTKRGGVFVNVVHDSVYWQDEHNRATMLSLSRGMLTLLYTTADDTDSSSDEGAENSAANTIDRVHVVRRRRYDRKNWGAKRRNNKRGPHHVYGEAWHRHDAILANSEMDRIATEARFEIVATERCRTSDGIPIYVQVLRA